MVKSAIVVLWCKEERRGKDRMNVKKWKQRIVPLFLAAVMVVSAALTGMPAEVQAEGSEGYLQSRITYRGGNTYLAYNDAFGEKEMFVWTGIGDTAESSQYYQFKETAEGVYVLISTQQGKNNAVAVGNTTAGSNVVVAETNESDTKQQWTFEAAPDGFYYVKNVATGLYMTTPRQSDSDAIDRVFLTIEEKRTENADSQLWKPSVAVNVYQAPTVEGYLASSVNTNQLLSVNGGDAVDGKDIIMWQGTEANQQWKFQPTAAGNEYYIVNAVTDMALAAADSNAGSQLVQKTKNDSSELQVWIFEKTGTDGSYYIRNKSTGLFITAESSNNFGKVLQQAGTGAALQIWNTDAEVNAVPSTIVPGEGLSGGLASAANTGTQSTDQYLAVSGGSTSDGAELSTWTGVNGGPEPNQVWEIRETGEEGVYRIVNTSSQRAIAAQNRVEGQRLVQKTIDENDETQLWSFVATEEEDTYRIWNNSTRFYLTADVKASGSRVLQKNYEDSDLQLWVTDEEVTTKTLTYDYTIDIVRKDGVSVSYTVDGATGEITFLASLREYYAFQDEENGTIQLKVNGEVKQGTDNGNNTFEFTVTPESDNAEITVQAVADVKTTDYYVINPEDNYPGRNQCLSPRVVEGLNGELYATFENGTPSEIKPDEYSFPIYRSDDKGETWVRVGELLNDDSVHPDSYYRITSYTDVGAPSTAEEVTADTEGAVRHPWSMQNCPQLFVLPEDTGDLKAGTLICAGVAVPVEEGAEEVADAGYGGLWDSSLDLYYSTDGGATWTFQSTIATGGENGRNIMGYDPVWEPFFVYYDDTLICYYSDETVPGDNGGQILVYKTSKDGGETWSDAVTIVDTNARPGMPVVAEMLTGQWILTYETVGWNPIKAGYKIAENPFDWENISDWGDTIPGINGTYGGSPYVYTLADGRIVAGTGSLQQVFVNTKLDGTGEWIAYDGAPAGYNRCYLQLSTGEFLIAGTEGSGFAGQGNKIFVKVLDPETDLGPVPNLSSIDVTAPAKTEYSKGEALDLAGMTVTANYTNFDSIELSDDFYTVIGYDANKAGSQEITVSYEGKTDTFTVTVAGDEDDAVLEEIKVTTLPQKTEYNIGDKLDTTGMVVTGYYSDGSSRTLDASAYTAAYDFSTAGSKTVTITCGELTTSFNVTVKEASTEPGDGDEDPGQPGDGDQKPGSGSQGGQDTDNSGNDKTDNKDGQSGAPQTGDTTPLGMYTMVLLVCAGVIVFIVNGKARKNRK